MAYHRVENRIKIKNGLTSKKYLTDQPILKFDFYNIVI